jgi:uncharacterized membrane protein HdeD (DUF308 family)
MTGDIHKVMANSITDDIRKATTWSFALSVLMIAAGVLAIFSPAIAGVAVAVFFGWLLIFSGILHLAYAWQAGRAGAVVWEMLVGMFSAARHHLSPAVAGLGSRAGVGDHCARRSGVRAVFRRGAQGRGWPLFGGIDRGAGRDNQARLAVSSVWAIGALVGVSTFASGITRRGPRSPCAGRGVTAAGPENRSQGALHT